MADNEPHEVLGVARDASKEEVRDAYREMVKEHHPDVSEDDNAEERFVRIRDAYEVMRERAEERGPTGDGSNGKTGKGRNGRDSRNSRGQGRRGKAPEGQKSNSTQSEHKRRRKERRKTWEDPWKEGEKEERRRKKSNRGREKIDTLGYGWSLFRENGSFFISKRGGRGRVYIGDDGRSRENKFRFSDRDEAEEAYERHVERKNEQRRTFSLGDGWRIVERASGYAVEGEEGYLGFDGRLQDLPYWFTSRSEAKSMHESYVRRKQEEDEESLASRVTVGAALLPFLVTVSILGVLSSSLGLGTKGKNPYLSAALTSAFFGTLAILLSNYFPFFAFVLLFLAIWAGVEFVVMLAGPYTAEEISGNG